GEYIVLEGDEYDTSFWDKRPKFWNYRPFVAMLNNIEHDHVDIYPTLENVKYAFERFINLVPQNGLLAVSRENHNAYNLAKNKAKSPVLTYGISKEDYTARNFKSDGIYTYFHVFNNGHLLSEIRTKLFGEYNISNILGAITVARFLKIPMNKIRSAVESFEGVKRRQEIIGEKNGVIVIDDYAHHPTAVRETLDAIRLRFHGKRIVC